AASATAVLNIDPAALAGSRSVTLTTGAELVTLANGFTVTNGGPALTQVSPNTGQQGQQNLPITITGAFTHFSNASVVNLSGTGITVSAPTSVTANSITVNV